MGTQSSLFKSDAVFLSVTGVSECFFATDGTLSLVDHLGELNVAPRFAFNAAPEQTKFNLETSTRPSIAIDQ